jgi:hypothetical protein
MTFPFIRLHENESIFDRLLELGAKSNDGSGIRFRRKLADAVRCDEEFMNCLSSVKCVDCYAELQQKGIDWAGVTTDTSCSDVVDYLAQGGHCQEVARDSAAKKIFCGTYDSCVVWEDVNEDDDSPAPDDDAIATVNCTALKECDWPGIHKSFIGDGVW